MMDNILRQMNMLTELCMANASAVNVLQGNLAAVGNALPVASSASTSAPPGLGPGERSAQEQAHHSDDDEKPSPTQLYSESKAMDTAITKHIKKVGSPSLGEPPQAPPLDR